MHCNTATYYIIDLFVWTAGRWKQNYCSFSRLIQHNTVHNSVNILVFPIRHSYNCSINVIHLSLFADS